MSRPRVVHVYKDVYPPVEGGIERIIHHLARLTAADFEPVVLTAARGWGGGRRAIDTPHGPVEVIELGCVGRLLSTPLAPGFLWALGQTRADLFHFHVPHPTGEFAYLVSRLPTPAVATYHSDVVRQRLVMSVYGPLFERFLGQMHTIMPTSRRYLETSPWLGPHRERCTIVPLGYPLEDYLPTDAIRARAEALRRQHGAFILFLGCLRAYKGLDVLLDAIAEHPDLRVVIAGEGREGPVLREQAAALDLTGRVEFVGRVAHEEAVALLHAAAAFVLPAHQRSEAFGLCQIEAMTCGLPVVSTDLPTGVPEVNRHEETGLIVPPGDAGALGGALERLMADVDLRRRLGEAGRRRAAEHYTAERMASDVAAVYRRTLGT